jgi:anti-sigma factor RsiW
MLSKMFFNQKTTPCKWIRKHFSEYVDGMLSEDHRLQVHEHLKLCELCSDELDEFCRTLSLIADFREECLPDAIRNYRLPRSTFVEIFPSIQKERPPLTFEMFVPYVCAVILICALLSTWDLVEKREFHQHYNASNYVEVVAKI